MDIPLFFGAFFEESRSFEKVRRRSFHKHRSAFLFRVFFNPVDCNFVIYIAFFQVTFQTTSSSMPVYNKVPFRRKKPDPTIKDDDMVFFMAETKEVFTDYDEYFNRYIKINTLCWSCAVTGKTEMTFADALKSETEAIKEIVDTFPKSLLRPLLWFAHHLVYRGRLDDLVNDVYMISRDRYFVGEYVNFSKTDHTRVKGYITAVRHVPSRAPWHQRSVETSESDRESSVASSSKKKAVPKPLEPDAPPAESYLYSFRQEGDSDDDEDENVWHDLTNSRFSRPKTVGSRQKVKLCLKEMTRLDGDKIVVLKSVLEENGIEDLQYEDFFAGPKPIFQQLGRVRQPVNFNYNGEELEVDQNDASPKKKQRKSLKHDKLMKKIEDQQNDLRDLFETAQSFRIDISKWQQFDRVLTSKDIAQLKEAIKAGKEDFKEREKERKKLEKERQIQARKPRDDLLCDDLTPLPPLVPLVLPDYINDETFANVLSLSQFFATEFADKNITFRDCLVAVCSPPTSSNSPLVKILDAMLYARAEYVELDDGDECNFSNAAETSNDTNFAANHVIYGDSVRRVNRLHQHYRTMLGCRPDSLSRDWRCLSETVRLGMITSGYCPKPVAYGKRFGEGKPNLHCFDDPVFAMLQEDDSISQKLETVSLFELTQEERLTLLLTLREQLLQYHSFKEENNRKILQIPEIRKACKLLRAWDAEQDRHSRTMPTDEPPSSKKAVSKAVQKLRSYVKAINEGLRIRDFDEIKEIMMTSVPYEELTPIEAKDVRDQQKKFFEEKLEELNEQQYEAFCKLGIARLGRDRAYRRYHYFTQFPVILVESVEDRGECDEPTPIRDPKGFSDEEMTEERVHLMACTGDMESCPVHGEPKHSKWSVLAAPNAIDSLIDAMNPRGFRESELAETLAVFKPHLAIAVDQVAALLPASIPLENGLAMTESPVPETPSLIKHLQLEPVVETTTSPNDKILSAVIKQLLNLETRIVSARVGALRLPRGQTVERFRNALLEKSDLRPFLLDTDREHHSHADVWLTKEEIDALAEDGSYIGQLKLAMVKIIHSVKLKYLFDPFTQWEYRAKGNGFLSATKAFLKWQKELLQCKSPSAVSLWASVFESNIVFSKHVLKCTTCRKPALLPESVTCDACGIRYHNACAPSTLSTRADWICKPCSSKEDVKNEGKARAALQAPNNESAYVGLDDSDEEKAEEVDEDVADNNSSIENHHAPVVASSKSSARSSKAKPFAQSAPVSRKRAAKPDKEYDEQYAFKSSNPDVSTRRKSNRLPAPKHKPDNAEDQSNYRAVAMGLRNAGAHEDDVRKQLQSCLGIIQKRICETVAFPFAAPVNKKFTEYHRVVHNPMDLRSMINKFKNLDYRSPSDVWQDAKLIFSNCRLFNEEGSETRIAGVKLEKMLKEDFREFLGDEVDR
uniref:Bromo domain-containing protein n=1 Tax=Panagrellus redivivus TaxID=6233 RepID=A0A7E4W7W0_PANRE